MHKDYIRVFQNIRDSYLNSDPILSETLETLKKERINLESTRNSLIQFYMKLVSTEKIQVDAEIDSLLGSLCSSIEHYFYESFFRYNDIGVLERNGFKKGYGTSHYRDLIKCLEELVFLDYDWSKAECTEIGNLDSLGQMGKVFSEYSAELPNRYNNTLTIFNLLEEKLSKK